jgi:hypothetical protein
VLPLSCGNELFFYSTIDADVIEASITPNYSCTDSTCTQVEFVHCTISQHHHKPTRFNSEDPFPVRVDPGWNKTERNKDILLTC